MKIGIAYDTPEMYDFAFSFAGEDREIVDSIKTIILEHNYTVFYDKDYEDILSGKDLYSYLREVFKNKCKFVVCFISENYTKKVWTNLEFTAVKERFLSTFFASDFLIPILLDDLNTLKDIPTYIGYYKHKSIIKTSKILLQKIRNSLAEDNYLTNLSHCIEYICNQVYQKLIERGYKSNKTGNTLTLNAYNSIHSFSFLSDDILNIPSILIFCDGKTYPDLFVTWNRNEQLSFDVYSFQEICKCNKDLGMRELVELLAKKILTYREK